MPPVSSASGSDTTMASARPMKWRSASSEKLSSTSAEQGTPVRFATTTRMPNALARAAIAWPMWPKPRSPIAWLPSSLRGVPPQ